METIVKTSYMTLQRIRGFKEDILSVTRPTTDGGYSGSNFESGSTTETSFSKNLDFILPSS